MIIGYGIYKAITTDGQGSMISGLTRSHHITTTDTVG